MNGTYMHALCAPLWYLHFEHTTYILYVNGGTSHVTVAHAACVRISMHVFFILLALKSPSSTIATEFKCFMLFSWCSLSG